MIGNTDFSQAYSHNVKLLYIDEQMLPIPYDFDMAGLEIVHMPCDCVLLPSDLSICNTGSYGLILNPILVILTQFL